MNNDATWRRPSVQLAAIACVSVACLLPFIGRAFDIDDPIFLWPAQQIAVGDARPLAATANWYGATSTLLDVTNHPLLWPAVLAGVGRIAGFGERAMHAATLVFAVVALLGTYAIARRTTPHAWLAAGLTLIAPAFFVSATTAMSDVPLLALWTLAVVLWMAARDRSSAGLYLLAGLVAAAATMTKYPGLALVPLLATQCRRRAWPAQAIALALPVAAIVGWEVYTRAAYGRGALRVALDYAAEGDRWATLPRQLVVGLSFLGGCFPAAALVALGFTRRSLVVTAGIWLVIAVAVVLMPDRLASDRATTLAHVVVFVGIGVAIVVAAGQELLRPRDADARLIGCWVLGVFAFAAVVNWTTNARSMLPAAPAIAILAARQLARSKHRFAMPLAGVVIVGSGALSYALADADAQSADGVRSAVATIRQRAGASTGTLWFTGHWGFQWYMEPRGTAIDQFTSTLRAGDLFVWPGSNTNAALMPEIATRRIDALSVRLDTRATPRPRGAASFYASVLGPVPYELGSTPPLEFVVYRVTRNILPPDAPSTTSTTRP